MYEELIEQLRDAARHKEDWGCYGCPVNCADSCSLDEAADAIEELNYKYQKALSDLVKQAKPPEEEH